MTDETVAFTLAQPDPAGRRRAYWLTGVTLFIAWNLGAPAGRRCWAARPATRPRSGWTRRSRPA